MKYRNKFIRNPLALCIVEAHAWHEHIAGEKEWFG